jgi:hypothetical protein
MELRDDDAFWAARRVAAFTDNLIRAAVHTGEFSNPEAEKYLGDVLIQRRDKITTTYLNAVNPVVNPRLDANGRLTFDNAAFDAGVAEGPAAYRASWFLFDNTTGERRPLSESKANEPVLQAPGSLPTAEGSYVSADISVDAAAHPIWAKPVRAYFRREGSGWKLVGLERMPESAGSARATPQTVQ